MENENILVRFITAQEIKFDDAFKEIRNGRKISHWMWYIFPQISGLGHSDTAKFYGIKDINEAQLYFNHFILGERLSKISQALHEIDGKTAYQIFGYPDDLKLKSCMTLFSVLKTTNPIFEQVLIKYFDGQKDSKTLKILNQTI